MPLLLLLFYHTVDAYSECQQLLRDGTFYLIFILQMKLNKKDTVKLILIVSTIGPMFWNCP